MEGQVGRRRINTIAGHFAAPDEISGAAASILPMNCSSLNSVIRRSDNRTYFARQSSSCQGYFMRQASTEKLSSAQPSAPLKCPGSMRNTSSSANEAPLFSRPATKPEQNFTNLGAKSPLAHECRLSALEPPKFSRPDRTADGQQQSLSLKKICDSASRGLGQSPRMDVAESGRNYIVMVELPGVSISDIRVEVNDQFLIVSGNNSTRWWRVAKSNDTISAYHKREISQGPYQVVWTLPANVNKDNVSAEFVDGLLRVTIPKLK